MKDNKTVKNKILIVAKSLLKENGSFTIKEIADECYINIAAVNYHFGSKDTLLGIVLKDVVTELKTLLREAIETLPRDSSNEQSMEKILDLTYSYALENMGIIHYLFLQAEYQGNNSHILIKEFFSDTPFTEEIYVKISEATNETDSETLKVKYLLLFSSFAIPLFIEILGMKTKEDLMSIKGPSFRNKYIKELLKILYD